MKFRGLAILFVLSPLFLVGQSAPTVEFVRFSPAAIFGDGVDPTTIQVRVSGQPLNRVQIVLSSFPSGIIPITTLELFDDGTNGDERPGDQIFSRSGVTLVGSQNALIFGNLRLTATNGALTSMSPLESRFFLVSPSNRLPVVRLNDDVQVTTNLVNLRDDGRIFRLTPSTSTTGPLNMSVLSSKFYEYFPDDYEFLAVFSSVGTTNGTLFHVTARNDVEGIGLGTFNVTSTYGSAGKLRGVNFLGHGGGGGLLHETMHQWAAYLNRNLEIGDAGGGHWGAVNIPGHLFGVDFSANDDGTYTITQAITTVNRLYPPMELYLMGLIPPDEVPDVTVLRGIDPRSLRQGQIVQPTSVRTVTMAEILALHGARVPNVSTSPKDFRMAGVLVTPGRLATEAEIAATNRTMARFGSDETAPMGDFGEGSYPFAFATGNRARMDTRVDNPGIPAAVSQRIFPLGGSTSWHTNGTAASPAAGYATFRTSSGSNFVMDGLAIFGSRQHGALVSEAAVPLSVPVTRGRIFAEIQPPLATGIALANPNSQPALISFYFTDLEGRNVGNSSATLQPGEQIARFLDQTPYSGPQSFTGTFTFTSSVPVAAVALRGRTNERGEFLMTTLPVADPGVPTQGNIVVPHFVAGGGWRTEILLVNPVDTPVNGSVEFWGQGSSNVQGEPVFVNINGLDVTSKAYTIPARTSYRIQMSGLAPEVTAGWARIVPSSGNVTPVGLVVFSFSKDAVTISEAGVSASRTTSTAVIHAQVYQPSGEPQSIQTGLAIANPTNAPITVTLTLLSGDSQSRGSANLTIPANGQRALFLSEIPGFDSLASPAIFQGAVSIAAAPNQSFAVTGLRGRYNERGEFLIIGTPPFEGNRFSTVHVFPQIVDGGGYSTQLIVRGFGGSTTMRFFDAVGQSMPLRIR